MRDGEPIWTPLERSLLKDVRNLKAERDKLRDTHQQVLAWMRQTDSALPMDDVIKVLEADLEPTK